MSSTPTHRIIVKYIFCSLSPVIQSLIALVNDPQPEHPLRADLAEEYSKDRKKFFKNAEEFTKKHGEKRPVDWYRMGVSPIFLLCPLLQNRFPPNPSPRQSALTLGHPWIQHPESQTHFTFGRKTRDFSASGCRSVLKLWSGECANKNLIKVVRFGGGEG